MKVIKCRKKRRKRQAERLSSYLSKQRETHGTLEFNIHQMFNNSKYHVVTDSNLKICFVRIGKLIKTRLHNCNVKKKKSPDAHYQLCISRPKTNV